MKILRWILFIPISLFGVGLFTYLHTKQFPTFVWLDYLCKPIINAIIFFYISRFIIPSTTETKNRLPLILIIIGNCVGLLFFFFYFYLIYTNKVKLEIKYIFSFIGTLTALFGSIYVICSSKVLKQLEEEKNNE